MSHETGLSKTRVERLTDSIFAVVTTLLVLDISVPQISSSHDAIDTEFGKGSLQLLKIEHRLSII
jgi:uncharacterized membrane protein